MNAQPTTLRAAQIARVNRSRGTASTDPAAIAAADEASRLAAEEIRAARSADAAQAPAGAAPPANAATTDRPKEVARISPAHLQLREYACNSFFAVAPAGAIPSDFHLSALPFELVAEHLTRFSTMLIVDQQGAWALDGLIVDHLPPSFALLHVTNVIDIGPRASAKRDIVPEGFIIRQGEAHEEPWLVIRKSDGVCLNPGKFHGSFEEARSYLLAHATVRQAPAAKMY